MILQTTMPDGTVRPATPTEIQAHADAVGGDLAARLLFELHQKTVDAVEQRRMSLGDVEPPPTQPAPRKRKASRGQRSED